MQTKSDISGNAAQPVKIKEIVIWGLIFTLAVIMLFTGINHEGLWIDEAWSVGMARNSIPGIIQMTGKDVHPPLYYIMLKGITSLIGDSETSVRFLSILAVLGILGLGAGPVRKLFGSKTAFVFAALVLFTPAFLVFGQETRSYTWSCFFSTAAALYGFLALKDNKTVQWILLGLFTTAAAYTHNFALMTVGFLHLCLFIYILIKDRSKLKPYLITAGATLLLYLPWFFILVSQISKVTEGFWINPLTPYTILESFTFPFAYKNSYPLYPVLSIGITILVFALIIFGFICNRKKKEKTPATFTLLSLILYTATLGTAILISILVAPILFPKYMISCLGLLLITAAIGITRLPGKKIFTGAMILFCLLNIPQFLTIYTQQFNGPIHEMVEDIKTEVKPDDVFLHSSWHCYLTLCYYFPKNNHYLSMPDSWLGATNSFKGLFSRNGFFEQDYGNLFKKADKVWLINDAYGETPISENKIAKIKGWEQIGETQKYYTEASWLRPFVSRFELTGERNIASIDAVLGKDADLSGKLTLQIKNVRSKKGTIGIALYNSDPITANNTLKYNTLPCDNETLVFSYENLDFDDYGIWLFHDENGNYRYDFTEDGAGISNINYFAKARVHFKQIKFEFSRDRQEVVINVYYPEGNEIALK